MTSVLFLLFCNLDDIISKRSNKKILLNFKRVFLCFFTNTLFLLGFVAIVDNSAISKISLK